MSYFRKIRSEGIPLKTVRIWFLAVASAVSLLLLYATFHATLSLSGLTKATDDYIALQKAAYQLMDASDYLTEMVQRFSAAGEVKYLDKYFEEALVNRRREEAIEIMSANPNSESALEQLELALRESVELMDREYYSMKLVIEAMGYKDYPKALQTVELKPEDESLSADEKMRLAEQMVIDSDYYNKKDKVRTNMKNSLDRLEQLTQQQQAESASRLRTELYVVCVIIVLHIIITVLMIRFASGVTVTPVLDAASSIKEDKPIPVNGAKEFRYLAEAYNRMQEAGKTAGQDTAQGYNSAHSLR
ncbi:MAG: hypothetical protein IJV16_00925 [Lachnospiraceae bacterium]|nr:hypothetical protein [Lachnospiraceae bacterium]